MSAREHQLMKSEEESLAPFSFGVCLWDLKAHMSTCVGVRLMFDVDGSHFCLHLMTVDTTVIYTMWRSIRLCLSLQKDSYGVVKYGEF